MIQHQAAVCLTAILCSAAAPAGNMLRSHLEHKHTVSQGDEEQRKKHADEKSLLLLLLLFFLKQRDRFCFSSLPSKYEAAVTMQTQVNRSSNAR